MASGLSVLGINRCYSACLDFEEQVQAVCESLPPLVVDSEDDPSNPAVAAATASAAAIAGAGALSYGEVISDRLRGRG